MVQCNARAVCARNVRKDGEKSKRVPAGFRVCGLMVSEGSMMKPFPIPFDMVWTGCTEYIPAAGEERAAELAGSCSSSRREDEQANGARGAVV